MRFNIFIYLTLLLLISCSNEEKLNEQDSGDIVENISIYLQNRNIAPDTDNLEPGEVATITDTNSLLNEDSKLFISQLGTTQSPNFTDMSSQADPYLYIYQYNENQKSDWYSGYNFITETGRNPIDWKDVKRVGSVGNAFSFYAFYFPNGNEVNFSVETDQSDINNFIKSDILGGRYETSALYTRIRFRLFHLMVYLKVTIYVPVLKSTVTSNSAEYSGFEENALQSAYILNAYKDFTIDWIAKNPVDIRVPVTGTFNNKVNSITMYKHETSSESFPLKNIEEFYPATDDPEDEVRAYNFSVLFPAQKFDNNFLCFQLVAPDKQLKYYYFSGDQVNTTTGDYGLNQGTLQQLYLYIPRKTNETILIKANKFPWYNSSTEMTVTKKEGNAQE